MSVRSLPLNLCVQQSKDRRLHLWPVTPRPERVKKVFVLRSIQSSKHSPNYEKKQVNAVHIPRYKYAYCSRDKVQTSSSRLHRVIDQCQLLTVRTLF